MTSSEPPTLEFFFDYGSPFSYLADTELPQIAKRRGVALVYRPMLLGAVLKATGNSSPMTVPAKGRYLIRDLERSKRGQQMSSPEFHQTAEEITDKTRRVFEIASDEENTGNALESKPKTTEDVKPR